MKQRQRSLIKLRERQPKATLIPFNVDSLALPLYLRLPLYLSLSLSWQLELPTNSNSQPTRSFGQLVEDLTCVCNLVAFHFSRKVVRLFCWLFITFALVSLQFVGFPTRFSRCQCRCRCHCCCLCFNFIPGIVSFMTNKQTFGELRRRVTCGLRKVPSVSENFAGKRKSNGINKQPHTGTERERGETARKRGKLAKQKRTWKWEWK